LSEQASF